MHDLKTKLKNAGTIIKRYSIPKIIFPTLMAITVLVLFCFFLNSVTISGVAPNVNTNYFTDTVSTDRLISMSFSPGLTPVPAEEKDSDYSHGETFDEHFNMNNDKNNGDNNNNNNNSESNNNNSNNGETEIPEGALPVISTTYKTVHWMTEYKGVAINNEAAREYSLEKIVDSLPDIKLSNTKEPQVLIYHTHATESYNDDVPYYYTNGRFRSDDDTKNMVSVGDIMTKMLEDAGYTVIHDKTQHDNPNYNTAYASSREVAYEYMKKYPSIKIVLDVHRDTIVTGSGTKYRPVVDINGEQTAQVMLLMGAGTSSYANEHWQENLKFATELQKVAMNKYPNLMRPILLRNSLYNQFISNGALLLEMGSCGNTLQEAKNSAKYVTECLIEVLDKLK